MPLATSGGATVSGAQIQDESISNDDIAPNAAIAQSKLDLTGGTVTVEKTAGATHSLTTTGVETVIVWAYGDVEQGHFGNEVVTLAYNGVTKDTAESDDDNITANFRFTYALCYSETPAAGTQNITLAAGTGSLVNPRIFVMKIFP